MPPIDADHLPEGDEKVAAVRSMFDTIAPRYDLVNRVMTFGLDVGWRRRAVRELGLPPRSVVADIACGTGDVCRELDAIGLEPIGIDLSFGMLAAATTDAPILQGDGLRLPFPTASIDGVTCSFALRNLVDLDAFLVEVARVLRPGGRIAFLEVAEPPNRVLQAGHKIYFGRVVPVIGGALSDRSAYRYLPKSVAYLPPPDQMMTMIRDAGFIGSQRTLLSGGIAQLVTGTRERPEWTVG